MTIDLFVPSAAPLTYQAVSQKQGKPFPSRPEDLRETHARERNLNRGLCCREVPLPHPHDPGRQRSRLPGEVPLARTRHRDEPCLYQTANKNDVDLEAGLME